MRRFEIQSTLEGSTGEPIGEGVEFGNGVAVVNWARPFSSSVEVFAGGMDALALHTPNADIVWLDKPPVPALCQPEEEEPAGRHARPINLEEVQAIEHLTQEVWNGEPLPEALAPPTDGPPRPADIFYVLHPGGLMRCCTGTFKRVMSERQAAGFADGREGDRIPCDHCSSAIIRKEGEWRWDQP